jgi:tRNA A-37 threonylcarbamoyl transferase component Bud32/tetratricopeptide (TPR) repeat protein
VDDEVRELVRAERLLAAADLASTRGDPKTASELYEQACDWARAAGEAMRAGEPVRALYLAAEGRDERVAAEAIKQLVGEGKGSEGAAIQLERRGHFAWAARLHEATGRRAQAAHAWERAGEAVRAAELLEQASDAVGAARALEAAMRREPLRWELHVALGRLLLRYGKVDAAVRALQKVPLDAPETRSALTYLVLALGRLGLAQAEAEARAALERCGGPVSDAPPAPAAAAKTRLFGRYEVLREVASTATARVLECTDAVRGEHVAVKIFAAYDTRGAGRDALARFEREVRVLGAMEHPNIVPLRDYLPEGPAIVLAWMSGGTLEERITKGGIVPARAMEIACAVLIALGEAHRLTVLHRDIKPANVLFDGAGVARLADFGVAHLGDLSATATAGVFGTLAYMSPEQREGRPATVQSDLYGVGVMLFEMLTGERPTAGEAPRILPSAAHRDLHPGHDRALLRLIAQEPSERPPDAFAARRELMSFRWPSDLQPAAPVTAQATSDASVPAGSGRLGSVRPAAVRVDRDKDGALVDRWMGRRVERVKLTERTLARAGAFARAGHRGLQLVLRVDREEAQIWLGVPKGAPATRVLDAAEIAQVRAALDALHDAGAVHGAVDRSHVVIDPAGAVTLLFTESVEPTATSDRDRLALARLGEP